MRWVNAVLSLLAGAVVGFIFLGEFRLVVFAPVLVGLAAFAILTLVAAVRQQTRLSGWALFLAAALITPLMIDGSIVGLPRCGSDLGLGVPCVGSDRDYQTPFYADVGIFAVAAVASVLHLRFAWRSRG